MASVVWKYGKMDIYIYPVQKILYRVWDDAKVTVNSANVQVDKVVDKYERPFCQAEKGWQKDFERNFCPENHAGCKTGLDNKHIMGYKERERSAQGDSLPAKGEEGRAAMVCAA